MKIRMPAHKWQIFFVTGFASIVTSISLSSLNLAFPAISGEFGISMSVVSLLTLVFTIISSCTLLIFGKTADLYGYKRQFISGFVVFGISSALVPLLAKGFAGLVLFRCIQGIGYSMLLSISQGLVNKSFPANERGKALGLNSTFVSIGYTIAPSIGGFLLTYFSWRSIFIFNIPFCVLGIIFSVIILKKDTPEEKTSRGMDWSGSLFFAVFIGLIALATNFSSEWGIVSIKFIGCILICVCSILVFILRENRTANPLMKLNLFRNPVFALANSSHFLTNVFLQMTVFLLPFYLIDVLLLSSSHSGLLLLTSPTVTMLLAPVGGRLTDRYGSRKPALAGLLVLVAGCLLMSFTNETTAPLTVVLVLLFYGSGIGLASPAINSAIFSAVPKEDSGMASGMVATVRNMGCTMGVAFGASIMAMRQSYYLSAITDTGAGGPDGSKVFVMAQRDTYYFAFIIALLSVLCIFLIPKIASKSSQPRNG